MNKNYIGQRRSYNHFATEPNRPYNAAAMAAISLMINRMASNDRDEAIYKRKSIEWVCDAYEGVMQEAGRRNIARIVGNGGNAARNMAKYK